MYWAQIFRENWNCYALSIFRAFILLTSSDSDKHMLMRQKCKQEFAYTWPYGSISNSSIIHQEKTKKITTDTVVWICVPNYHKILQNVALNFCENYWSFEKPYQTLESVFHQLSSTSKSKKKNLAAPSFSTYLSCQCSHIWYNTPSRVWYVTSNTTNSFSTHVQCWIYLIQCILLYDITTPTFTTRNVSLP